MAITYTTDVDVRGVTQDVFVVSGTVGTDARVIQKNAIAPFDKKHLDLIHDKIAADAAITTFDEALADYTMPNGQTATNYYDAFIFALETANEAAKSQAEKDIEAHAATLADHETRITTLEP